MRRNVVSQIAHLSATARFRQTIAHGTQLMHQGVDLLLLPVHQRIELVQQVFGKARLDFKLNQAVFNSGWDVHALYWT